MSQSSFGKSKSKSKRELCVERNAYRLQLEIIQRDMHDMHKALERGDYTQLEYIVRTVDTSVTKNITGLDK